MILEQYNETLMDVYLRVPGLSTYPLKKTEEVIENGQSRDIVNSGQTRHSVSVLFFRCVECPGT